MIKRIIFLTFSLACLIILAFWWHNTDQTNGQVKGRINNTQIDTAITPVYDFPFISDVEGKWKIYAYESNRDNLVPLISDDALQYLPVMINSEDLWYFDRAADFNRLWHYNILKQEKEYILGLRQEPDSLIISPDKHLAVYTLKDSLGSAGSRRAFLVFLDSKEVVEIGSGIKSIQLSPDSRRIVYCTSDGIYYSEILRDQKLTASLLILAGNTYSPVFSKTGETIYYLIKDNISVGLYQKDLRLNEDKKIADLSNQEGISDWQLEISPDNKTILYNAIVDQSTLLGNIGQVSIETGIEMITNAKGIFVCWSTSGEYIYYNVLELSSTGPKIQIWKMTAEGNYREAITHSGSNWLSLPGNFQINS